MTAPIIPNGTKFRLWTVIDHRQKPLYGNVAYTVQCVCGTKSIVPGSVLRSGNSQGCLPCRNIEKGKAISAAHNLSGQIFDVKVIQKLTTQNNSGSYYYTCECSICNTEFDTTRPRFAKSCGCIGVGRRKGPTIDRIGMKFQMLTVLSMVPDIRVCNQIMYICLCECGNTCRVSACNLSKQLSCGCMCFQSHPTHGMSQWGKNENYPSYQKWKNMLSMTSNPKDHKYKWYGGKNVKVCQRWKSFENFLEDMGHPPVRGRWALSRKNKKKDFNKENCIWIPWNSGRKKKEK